jgi:capsid protein
VQPWEIRPGHLIRINGLSARSDALLATGPDGRSVFRIAAVEYSTDSAAATLELDTWPRNVAQALSRMKKAQSVTRRK